MAFHQLTEIPLTNFSKFRCVFRARHSNSSLCKLLHAQRKTEDICIWPWAITVLEHRISSPKSFYFREPTYCYSHTGTGLGLRNLVMAAFGSGTTAARMRTHPPPSLNDATQEPHLQSITDRKYNWLWAVHKSRALCSCVISTYQHWLQAVLVTHHLFEKDAVERNKKYKSIRKLKLQVQVTWTGLSSGTLPSFIILE